MSRNITVEYIRPGKETSYYEEDLLVENDEYLKSFKRLPDEIGEKLTQSLRDNGFIALDQFCACITKTYFFHEYFNILQFQNQQEELLGYYSDIGTPLSRTEHGFQMTDWFLDLWLSPDGTLFELDMDEFEEALSGNLLSPTEAEIARNAFRRLIDEVKRGIYPDTYLK